jgi:anti-sigma regulatory factor (Ser/Thr protein kinase)
MEVIEQQAIALGDATQTGAVRRVAAALAESVGLDATAAGKLAIVVTEAATNLAKHAAHGQILLRTLRRDGARGVGILVLDDGPGIANLAQCMGDGFSTAGSPGTGLGAMMRQSSLFDVYSNARGTVLVSHVLATNRAASGASMPLEVGAVSLQKPGEDVCGDAWALGPEHHGRSLVLVVDGLGHGAGAAEAAHAAVRIFREHAAGLAPAALVERMHAGLRPTRGAAAAVAQLDRGARLIRFAGIGNITGAVIAQAGQRNMVSHHGTLGHDVRKVQEFSYPWPPGATIVLHSDGIGTRWNLDTYPGLAARHPMVVAGVIYRDFRRGRDDATIVVLRERS